MKYIEVDGKKCVVLNDKAYDFEYMVNVMDPEIREYLHNKEDWNGNYQKFAEKYFEEHINKYGDKDAQIWLNESNYRVECKYADYGVSVTVCRTNYEFTFKELLDILDNMGDWTDFVPGTDDCIDGVDAIYAMAKELEIDPDEKDEYGYRVFEDLYEVQSAIEEVLGLVY